ncbi:MAG: hypothetical protein V1919_03010 [Candidatus Omnitrophota bacterium]
MAKIIVTNQMVEETRGRLSVLVKPEIVEGKVIKLGSDKDISVSEKLYSEVEDFFNRAMVAVKKEFLTMGITQWRTAPFKERTTRQTVKDLLKNPKTQGEKIIAARFKSASPEWRNNLIRALIDHCRGVGENYFSKDHFFGRIEKKEFDAIMKKTQPARGSRTRGKAKGKLQEFREAATNSNGKTETTKGKKGETAKRMRRAKTAVTAVKTEAPRARDAKPVEVEVKVPEIKRLPKVRG